MKSHEGSNPSLSAKKSSKLKGLLDFLFFANACCNRFLLVRTARFLLERRFLVLNRVRIRVCYLSPLGYIFPAASEIIRSRKKHSLFHCLCRGYLESVVEMGINICGSAEIRVPDPFLNLLQRHAISQQKAGATVAKIMKPHLWHSVFCYVLRKIRSQIVRAHLLSQLVHKNITVVIAVTPFMFCPIVSPVTIKKK